MPSATRNLELERLIAELAELLAPAERELVVPGEDVRRPLVLVVGAPRSGTTLSVQWLAASGCFAYPTNLLARFSSTPAVGARIQLMLTDPRFALGEELADLGSTPDWSSRLGKTVGALAPSEFMFFWRRFVATHELRHLSDEELARTRVDEMRASLAALERAFGKPLAMKGMMLQQNLAAFAEMLPRAFFLHVERDPLHNAQSLVAAREAYHGSRDEWYSVKPREYEALRGLDPLRQVAGQVLGTNRAIAEGLAELPEERWLHFRYEELCADPADVWARLSAKLGALGEPLPPYAGPEGFSATNANRLARADVEALRRALDGA